MFEAMAEGLAQLIDPFRMGMLFVGVLIGLAVGIIPGIGALVGLAIVLPFIWTMDPYAALPLMVGVMGVTVTADTITCVLLGIPGTAGSVATIVDGYPMAQKGEAARALSAAFGSSVIGGIIGAVLLAVSVPVFRPLVLMFGSPELFMLVVFGITMVAVLTGGKPIKGLVSAGLGLTLAGVGGSAVAGTIRYNFGIPYLYRGIPLIAVALGVFGIAEVVDLMRKGLPIAGIHSLGKGAREGIRDVIKEWRLIVRCSLLGAWLGFVPGIGTAVANWIGYGHAVQSAKGESCFGQGDVRGVIGPESANNATKGGELIPTLMFGVPGCASMALFLAAFMIMGISPGPDIVTKHLPLIFTMAWSLAIANVMGAAICVLLARQLARLTTVPIHTLVPFIIAIILIGAVQATQHWGDLVVLLVLSVVGWFMKQYGFPRPPLMVGFVLGSLAERYLSISVQRFGVAWLSRPLSIIIGLIAVVSLVMSIRWQRKRAQGGVR
ncbi:hypothetical protein ES707_21796 [subsurface metagenome]